MSILKRPILTEKTNDLVERGLTQYGFEVDLRAAKDQIKREIERVYEVEVDKVRTMVVRGKRRSRSTKSGIIVGKTSNYKKAIVTLKDGQEIDFYKHI
jgi:large subunit ribosomal protein L23